MTIRLVSFLASLRSQSFPSERDELAFWVKYDRRRLEFRKIFLVCAITIYSALGLLDLIAGGAATTDLLRIRFVGVCLVALIFIRFCKPSSPAAREAMIVSIGVVMVTTSTIMTLVGPPAVASTYPFLISAGMIFGSCLLLPRFNAQAAFCVITNLVYWPSTLFVDLPAHIFYTNLVVMLITTLAVVIGAMVREQFEREHALNEASLAKARDDALAAARAKSHLLANVSHELRTPLNAIIGFSELMNNKVFGEIEQENYCQYVRDIHFSGKLLHANINDLLDLARLEVDKMHWKDERFSLNETLERVISTCNPESRSISVSLSPGLRNTDIAMFGDPDRMSQVFINVITNAMKFSEDGASIWISHDIEPSGNLALYIADSGVGISEEDLERIREPFGQARQDSYIASNNGLGLGLSIVAGIMERCGGRLHIESELRIGTTVSLIIPAERVIMTPVRQRGFRRILNLQTATG